jgi:hypothetical protein
MHHGHVWAENVEPGLRVCVELPLDRPSSKIRDSSNAVRNACLGENNATETDYELEPGSANR